MARSYKIGLGANLKKYGLVIEVVIKKLGVIPLGRNKKNNVYPCKYQFYYIKVGFKGFEII